MAGAYDLVHDEPGPAPPIVARRNWGLIVALVLCVAVWTFVIVMLVSLF